MPEEEAQNGKKLGMIVPPAEPKPEPKATSFEPVDPNVNTERYQYTIVLASGEPVFVTANERSAKEALEKLGARIIEGTQCVAFPEAIVRADRIDSIAAGWGSDDGDDEEDEDEEEEPTPPPKKRRRVFG